MPSMLSSRSRLPRSSRMPLRLAIVPLSSLGALGALFALTSAMGACAKNVEPTVQPQDAAVEASAELPPTLGPTNGDPFAACATSDVQSEERPLDLLVLLDKSGSMAQSRKWFAVTAGLKAYFGSGSSAAVGLGLQMFPGESLCNETNYAKPVVDFLVEGEPREPLGAALDAVIPDGPTPMAPALWGAVQHAHERALAHPERNVAVLLATDGLPDQTCQFSSTGVPPNTLEGVETIAAQARAMIPRVSVAVIGVGAALGELNRIAAAGGTSGAAIIGDTPDQEAVFLQALEAVRRKTVPCEYAITRTEDDGLDFGKVNVGYQQTVGKEALTAVSSLEECAGVENGWRYNDPENPTQIELCPDTCRRLRDTSDGSIRLVFCCKTIIR